MMKRFCSLLGPVNQEPESIICSEFAVLFAMLFALANLEIENNAEFFYFLQFLIAKNIAINTANSLQIMLSGS